MPINLLEDEMPVRNIKSKPINLLADEMSTSREGLPQSIFMAPFRIGKDLGESAFEAIRGIPENIEKAKSEVPGLADLIFKDPSRLAKQFGAGLAEMGQRTFNTPHDIINYATSRLNLLPENLNKKVQMARMPEDTQNMINQSFGEPKMPGESLARGLGRNLNNEVLGIGLTKKLNPFQLTDKSIAKDIINSRNNMYEKYSGKNGLYDKLEEKATKRGVNLSNIDFNKINNELIDLSSIDKLKAQPTLKNAQKAISDLGHSERILERKKGGTGLNDMEKDRLKGIIETKDYIQENMFKDKSGKIHDDLLKEHKKIQQGYAKEVIPYTKNKAINEYRRGEKLEDQLVQSLQSGKFPAQRGKEHKPLMLRRSLPNLNNAITGGGLTGLGALGALLYQKLAEKNNE